MEPRPGSRTIYQEHQCPQHDREFPVVARASQSSLGHRSAAAVARAASITGSTLDRLDHSGHFCPDRGRCSGVGQAQIVLPTQGRECNRLRSTRAVSREEMYSIRRSRTRARRAPLCLLVRPRAGGGGRDVIHPRTASLLACSIEDCTRRWNLSAVISPCNVLLRGSGQSSKTA